MMLLGTCLLGLLPGSYYFYWYRRMKGSRFFFWGHLENKRGLRLEDRMTPPSPRAPASSTRSRVRASGPSMGMGAFLMLLGFVFGVWLSIPGISLMLLALVGVTAESRRGGHV